MRFRCDPARVARLCRPATGATLRPANPALRSRPPDILDGLSPDTVTACAALEAAEFADRAGAADLRLACLSCVTRHLAAVRRTPGFVSLSQPLLLEVALQSPLP